MTEHRDEVEELLAGYRRSRERLAAVHRELASISESATSADGLVTVNVGARGTLTGVELDDDVYDRRRPAELAAEIVRLTGEAAVRAFTAASEVLAPALPADSDPQALLLGTADLAAADLAVRESPADDVDEAESFEDQSWLAAADWPRPR